MDCKNISIFLLRRLWILIHSVCLRFFTIQISLLAVDQKYPSATVTTKERKQFSEIAFPVIFKICLKPGLDLANLKKLGYETVKKYFVGTSRFNKNLTGWAGHRDSGEHLTNSAGKYHRITTLVES